MYIIFYMLHSIEMRDSLREKFNRIKIRPINIGALYSCPISRDILSIVMINSRCNDLGLAFGVSNFHEGGLEAKTLMDHVHNSRGQRRQVDGRKVAFFI